MADVEDSGGGDASQTAAVADMAAFNKWLSRIIPVLLEEDDSVPGAFTAALSDRTVIDCVKKFLSDSQTPALIVQRLITSRGE